MIARIAHTTLLIALLGCQWAVAQTTKGTEFWFSYIQNLVTANPLVFISAETNVSGTVTIPGQGFTQNFNVAAGTTQVVTLNASAIVPYSEGLHPRAVRVVTCDSVTVYAVFPGAFSSDATVVFPKSSLGSEYRVLNMTGSPGDWGDAAQIVATENNTTVEITPSINTDGGRAAGVPFTVTLNQGDVYQLTHNPGNADLTGTRIVGMNVGECKPFAVISGSQCINIGGCTACDQIYDMLIPNSNLGQNYGLVPLAQKGQTIYRVMAIQNGTQVSVDGNVIATLNAGQFHQFQNNTYSYLTATGPVMVSQFARGVSCDQTGDPFKVSIFPIEQSINRITFNAFQTPIVNNFWVNVVSPTADVGTVTLDGNNIGGQFTPFPSNPTYSYARIQITVGDHTLNSGGGVLATIYGWGGAESFGYCAGASMKDLTNDFSIVTTPACQGETVTFTAVTDPATIDYVWDFGDGTPTQNGVTVTHSYNQNQSYIVALTKVKNNQCDIIITKPVDIIDPPIQILQPDTALCLGQFIDLIVPVNEPFLIPRVNGCGDTVNVEIIMEYDTIYWSTGHSGDSIRVTPTTDTVIYVYGQKFGSDCLARDSIVIRVVDLTAIVHATDACLRDEVCIQDLSLSNSAFSVASFFINDSLLAQGQSDFCFNYYQPGAHTIKLVLADPPSGCADSVTQQVQVFTHPITDFTFSDACHTDSVVFLSAVNGNGFVVSQHLWDFTSNSSTDATTVNAGHVYPSEGSYDVTLIAINEHGCADTLTQPLVIHPLPQPLFTATAECVGDSTAFTDQSTIATGTIVSYAWAFGDANASTGQSPMHLYGTSGSFWATLTAESDMGCTRAFSDSVRVHPLPVAGFTVVEACATFAVQFTNTTTGAVAYDWALGDGASSAALHPSHAYALPGQYDVRLTATTAFGCVDSVLQQIDVFAQPVAGFVSDTACALLPTSFTDTSTVSSGSINQWHWAIAPGVTSPVQNPTHVFTQGGIYNVFLRVTTDEGCRDSITQAVRVHHKPVAEFAWTDVCLNETTVFINQSTVGAGAAIVDWDWDFGDVPPGSSGAQGPTYPYGSSGQFNVTLMAETADGCRDTVSHVAEVFDLPVASFTVQDVCLYDPAVFINTSTIPSGSITSNIWDLGDGPVQDIHTPAPHTYPIHNTYGIRLITVSDHGCRDTMDRVLTIFPVPVADFTFDTVCFPLATQFIDQSTIPGNGAVNQWDWRFGDNNFNTVSQNPAHPYDSWGDYDVRLTVTSADGCVDDTIIGPARVYPKPTAIFSSTIANCFLDTTYFEEFSTIANYPADSVRAWMWELEPGIYSAQPAPWYIYPDEGFYDVTLIVTSNHGCRDTVAHQVEIYPLPRVAFSADTTRGCQPFRVQFFDNSEIPLPYTLARWQWDFGDGTDSISAQFPVHIYNNGTLGPFDQGIYSVTLTVTSGNGCVSSETYEGYITEYPKPDARFDVDPKRADLLFARMRVTDLSTPNVVDWLYDFGEGPLYTVQHPVHSYQDTGAFIITQYVETVFGCRDTAEFTVIVGPDFFFYIPNTFTPNNDGDNETFFGTGVGVAGYQMLIYDRWGSQIFESNAMSLHWDGTKNGHPVQQGVYVYMFHITDLKGDPHHYVGHVNLVR